MNTSPSLEQSSSPPDQSDQSIKARVITLAYNSDEQRAKDLLRRELEINPELDVLQLSDTRGYTCNQKLCWPSCLITLVLHISALNNLHELGLLVLSILREKVLDKSTIKTFVDSQTDEGFTALHFASFRGNIVTQFIIFDANVPFKRDWLKHLRRTEQI